jgi:hypothetical protein
MNVNSQKHGPLSNFAFNFNLRRLRLERHAQQMAALEVQYQQKIMTEVERQGAASSPCQTHIRLLSDPYQTPVETHIKPLSITH